MNFTYLQMCKFCNLPGVLRNKKTDNENTSHEITQLIHIKTAPLTGLQAKYRQKWTSSAARRMANSKCFGLFVAKQFETFGPRFPLIICISIKNRFAFMWACVFSVERFKNNLNKKSLDAESFF